MGMQAPSVISRANDRSIHLAHVVVVADTHRTSPRRAPRKEQDTYYYVDPARAVDDYIVT